MPFVLIVDTFPGWQFFDWCPVVEHGRQERAESGMPAFTAAILLHFVTFLLVLLSFLGLGQRAPARVFKRSSYSLERAAAF